MPDTRRHRGPDPRDAEAFGIPALPSLRGAVEDLSWLLERDYAMTSALKLVGDRWSLTERQRMGIRRSACSDSARASRQSRELAPTDLAGRKVFIDGFNILTTVESALGGAVILRGRDGCLRDLAGVHGTYRSVGETFPAIDLLGDGLASLQVEHVTWLLDSPVSNSGRLRGFLLRAAESRGANWQVDLVTNPDTLLQGASEVISADSLILDRCTSWFNMAHFVITSRVPAAWVIDLN
ncbi:DUF434 domain-containing protein [Singulisphaera rosea]